jgi:hypothetical protein
MTQQDNITLLKSIRTTPPIFTNGNSQTPRPYRIAVKHVATGKSLYMAVRDGNTIRDIKNMCCIDPENWVMCMDDMCILHDDAIYGDVKILINDWVLLFVHKTQIWK